MLPQEFLNRMEQMLGEEYPAFLESYEKEKQQSLRINPIKGETEQIKNKLPFSLSPVPWERHGFCYGGEDAPGRHPYHEAGVYYIQEPSAMAPVSYLMSDVYEENSGEEHGYSERILDLCAAPGGKSTQIAGAMYEAYQKGSWRDRGILISNEINPARAKILSENVERMGISNAVVTNETPWHLAELFKSYFTRILVDAPCSGEGMFRKNEEACTEWSPQNVQLCADRQDEILDCAASMLASGGKLVYSTCTFAPAENEGSMARFLHRHPEFSIEQVALAEGMSPGVPEWAYFDEAAQGQESRMLQGKQVPQRQQAAQENQVPQDKKLSGEQAEELRKTVRLFPHKINGEGHYLAVLRKEGSIPKGYQGYYRNGIEKGVSEKEKNVPGKGCVEFYEFARETLRGEWLQKQEEESLYLRFGEQLYFAPKEMPSVKGLKVLRPGLHLGTIKKNRFEPSHALALALKPEHVVHSMDFPAENRKSGETAAEAGSQVRNYLTGGTFPAEGEKGWYLISADGFSIGWGKLAGGVMKNHYPKGLRKY